ncbi:hypothetical protein DXA74_11410 [Bacteroides sp. OF04-15BH]|nr:hypothetical protein DXA74_11410 [Bacteroides sp. OF04-15BH]
MQFPEEEEQPTFFCLYPFMFLGFCCAFSAKKHLFCKTLIFSITPEEIFSVPVLFAGFPL